MDSSVFTKKNVKGFQTEFLKLRTFPITAGNCVFLISVPWVPFSNKAPTTGIG